MTLDLSKLNDMKYEVKVSAENLTPKHTLLTDRGECVECLADEQLAELKPLLN